MTSHTTVLPLRRSDEIDDPLTAVLRSGARRLLAQAVEAEAEAFLAEMRDLRLPDGRARLGRGRAGAAAAGRARAAGPAWSWAGTAGADWDRAGAGAAGEAARSRRWPGW